MPMFMKKVPLLTHQRISESFIAIIECKF